MLQFVIHSIHHHDHVMDVVPPGVTSDKTIKTYGHRHSSGSKTISIFLQRFLEPSQTSENGVSGPKAWGFRPTSPPVSFLPAVGRKQPFRSENQPFRSDLHRGFLLLAGNNLSVHALDDHLQNHVRRNANCRCASILSQKDSPISTLSHKATSFFGLADVASGTAQKAINASDTGGDYSADCQNGWCRREWPPPALNTYDGPNGVRLKVVHSGSTGLVKYTDLGDDTHANFLICNTSGAKNANTSGAKKLKHPTIRFAQPIVDVTFRLYESTKYSWLETNALNWNANPRLLWKESFRKDSSAGGDATVIDGWEDGVAQECTGHVAARLLPNSVCQLLAKRPAVMGGNHSFQPLCDARPHHSWSSGDNIGRWNEPFSKEATPVSYFELYIDGQFRDDSVQNGLQALVSNSGTVRPFHDQIRIALDRRSGNWVDIRDFAEDVKEAAALGKQFQKVAKYKS